MIVVDYRCNGDVQGEANILGLSIPTHFLTGEKAFRAMGEIEKNLDGNRVCFDTMPGFGLYHWQVLVPERHLTVLMQLFAA